MTTLASLVRNLNRRRTYSVQLQFKSSTTGTAKVNRPMDQHKHEDAPIHLEKLGAQNLGMERLDSVQHAIDKNTTEILTLLLNRHEGRHIKERPLPLIASDGEPMNVYLADFGVDYDSQTGHWTAE